jgi:hypothetical protein
MYGPWSPQWSIVFNGQKKRRLVTVSGPSASFGHCSEHMSKRGQGDTQKMLLSSECDFSRDGHRLACQVHAYLSTVYHDRLEPNVAMGRAAEVTAD